MGKTSVPSTTLRSAGHIDWSSARDKVDLAEVATRLLGPPEGRRGEKGRKLWWRCPLHEDNNPSFAIDPGKAWWKCYGCDAKGDAVELVRRLNSSLTFPQIVEFITGGVGAAAVGVSRPSNRVFPPREPAPSGLPLVSSLALVESSAELLWTPAGAHALAYLRGGAVPQ